MRYSRHHEGTRIEPARSEAEMLATAKRWAAEATAEASVLAWAETGAVDDDRRVDRAFETLHRDEMFTVEDLIRQWETPGLDPGQWGADGAVRTQPQPRAKRQPAPIVEDSTVEALLALGSTSGEGAGFTRIPNLLIHGEVVARMERLAAGLGWLLVVLLRYAERKHHEIRASKATLCRLTGIRKPETLDRWLRLLTRTNKAVGLPALLRKLPGTGVHYAFRQDGLAALGVLARQTLEREERRLAAIRKAQSRGGQTGMQTRWGSDKSSPAGRAGGYQSAGKERGRVSSHPSGTARDKCSSVRG